MHMERKFDLYECHTLNKFTNPHVRIFKMTTNFKTKIQLECGPMPNVMAALPNRGGALCLTPQSLADAHYWSAVQ